MQDRYFVYLLSAGDGKWGYIGHTGLKLRDRLRGHRNLIAKKNRSKLWMPALEEFPNPNDWEITEIAGPFETREEALEEEARLQEWAWDEPGRLWERRGNKHSSASRKRLRNSKLGNNNPNFGKSGTMLGKQHTLDAKVKMSARAKLREARKRAEKFFAWLSDPIT